MHGLIYRLAHRAALRKVTALRGHDWEASPTTWPVHFSTCPCGLGGRMMRRREDWRALAAHPVP